MVAGGPAVARVLDLFGAQLVAAVNRITAIAIMEIILSVLRSLSVLSMELTLYYADI